jgi:Na+-translocating ferredoxin:NAD+ oxidoreductase RnfD subunit
VNKGGARRRFLRSPKGITLLMLAVLSIIAAFPEGWRVVGPELAAACIAAVAIDLPILRRRRGRWHFPDGALLTGLFVGMILSPQTPWYVAAITAAVGVLAKYVIRARKANVFNPAALGLVATFYIFNTGQSWWGALSDIPLGALLLLIAFGIYITHRINKLAGVISFLGVYYLLVTAAAFVGDPRHVAELYRAPDLNATLFFAFFMVTDPPTSPPRSGDQIVYSVITAIVAYAVFAAIGAAYYLLAGLLVANVWEGARRVRAHAKRVILSAAKDPSSVILSEGSFT